MDRVAQLREARNSAHVSFAEYIKLRARSKGLILIFEGKQCPTAYIGWLQLLCRAFVDTGGQLIARGKKNVLALRNLVQGNPETAKDRNIYFVDRDYDVEPKPGAFVDVYVTRGYSIENYLISWVTIESYVRAYFDIADSDDYEALQLAKQRFQKAFENYLIEARELHHVVYICRTKGVECYPGDSVLSFFEVDWEAEIVRPLYQTTDELLGMLKIPPGEKQLILADLPIPDGFGDLDPVMDWRGKFHFSLARCFLIHLQQARLAGASPFKRAAKPNSDPSHPSLIGLLGSLSAYPQCLGAFVEQFASFNGMALAP